ncbi:uncharacterized protein [Primulina eburnea]|uniref:uncharacterized protein isoform X3 n=1 Tax=Primulina eburnea TaxID=1245227 RepID=UPI003C6C885B
MTILILFVKTFAIILYKLVVRLIGLKSFTLTYLFFFFIKQMYVSLVTARDSQCSHKLQWPIKTVQKKEMQNKDTQDALWLLKKLLRIQEQKINGSCLLKGHVNGGLLLGQLQGNRFTITLRSVIAETEDIIKESIGALGKKDFINYFRLQIRMHLWCRQTGKLPSRVQMPMVEMRENKTNGKLI